MNAKEFRRMLPQYESVIRAIARKLSRADDYLFKDLCQVGRITLWQVKPERAVSNLPSYIKHAIHNKMVDFLRKHGGHRHLSLDELIDGGWDLRTDEDGVHLVRTGNAKPWAKPWYWHHLEAASYV